MSRPAPTSFPLEGVGVIAQDIVVSPGTLFKVLFSLRSRLTGKVIGAPEGLVAVLYAPAAWGWTRQAPLDLQGAFTFDNLPPGRYRLEVGGQVFSDLVLTGENRLTLAPIDLSTGRRSVIRGRIADGAGQPKADRAVTLRRDDVVVAETRTAADGTYRFANLPAGVSTASRWQGSGKLQPISNSTVSARYVADGLWPKPGPARHLAGPRAERATAHRSRSPSCGCSRMAQRSARDRGGQQGRVQVHRPGSGNLCPRSGRRRSGCARHHPGTKMRRSSAMSPCPRAGEAANPLPALCDAAGGRSSRPRGGQASARIGKPLSDRRPSPAASASTRRSLPAGSPSSEIGFRPARRVHSGPPDAR